MNKYRGELMLFTVTLFAAAGWFVSKASLKELPPAGFLGIRFVGASLLFLPFALPKIRQLQRAQIFRAAAVGAAFTTNIFLWIQGVAHSQHFGEGAFLLSLSMLLAPLLSWLLFRHTPSRMLWISLAIAASGLYLLNSGRPLWHMSLGSLLFGAASIASALFFVLNNQFSKNMPALPLTTIQLGTAGLVCSIYSIGFETWHFPLSAASYGWLFIAILFITNARFLLQTHAQKLCPIGNGALIMVLEPVWTFVFSVILLGETLTWQKTLGGSLIIFGLLVYRLPLQWIGKRFRQPEKSSKF
ncbi:DMT family transporter [Wielerella bovis]|uniref:DMT family transporter n=1 Tax=Wielerella bovis TaxID=2917790 RepID=UPI002019ACF9|nr:DMT family transporter [Wielerella bovis]MCG7657653.1 DMT family transporter [Wielerella bovis]MCG7659874.1 DMT family transporter [Wielerella bovis]